MTEHEDICAGCGGARSIHVERRSALLCPDGSGYSFTLAEVSRLRHELASLRTALSAARAEALREAANVAARYARSEELGLCRDVASEIEEELRALACAPGSPPPAGGAGQPGDDGALREAARDAMNTCRLIERAMRLWIESGPGLVPLAAQYDAYAGQLKRDADAVEAALSEGRERIRAEGEDGR